MGGIAVFRQKSRIFINLSGLCALAFPSISTVVLAEVAVIPSSPPYNIQVLPGSTRQINVNITGGSLNTVNWSVLSTTGGAGATFTTPAASAVSTVMAGLPTVQVNIGGGTGNCTIPQPASAMGTYTVTSTATVTVQAQSVDDPTKSGTFLFNVCAKTTTVMVAPAYQQAFASQHRTLQSWISGDTDETGTWSIVAQPGGGNAVLADTTNRDTDFVATVTGRYTLQYISDSNPLKSATAIVYVSPNLLPAYVSTPNKTEPRECYVDPAFTGGDYEVGAGKEYPNLESTPAAGTLKPGSIIRVWNTDTTGSNPSTYHEYYQIASTGFPTQPMILCGVPDSLGNLPVIDGSNATGQASVSEDGAAAGAGIISVWPRGGTPYGYWQNGSAGPSYVTITGLHIAHGTPNYSYTPPGGGAATAYQIFTACLNIRSGSYIDLGGNNLDTCGLGVFTADNGNNGWASITQLVTVTGNHVQNAGITGQEGEHEAYIQTWYALLQGNLWDNYNRQASGSAIKWRGVEGIFRYNNVASGAQRLFDLVEVQDATPYITFDGYLSLPGDTNCDDSFYCLGDRAGANIIAAYQESFQKDFVYGNELFGLSSLQQIHYLADGGGGMQDRNGTLYFFSNTLDAAQNIFDTSSNGDGYYGYFPQRVDARNNILWANHAPYNGAEIQMSFSTESTIIMSATTNLMNAGKFTIQPPIEGALWEDNTEEGWSNTCDGPCQWPLTIPLNPHLYDLSNANYLTTATQPYNPTTMIPPAGSAAINAGTALIGILQTMPVRWQYSIASNSLIPRMNPQTIGAVDYAEEAVTPTFSPSAGDYTSAPTVTIETTTPSASIYYTTDGSTPTYPATGTTTLYVGPITVGASETVQAIVTATGFVQSSVASAAYEVGPLAATPAFSPVGGTYTSVQSVTISDSTQGSTIYYTTDGTTPSAGSNVYGGPITVSANETVQAIAAALSYSNSSVGSASFTINDAQTALPTFTPAGGTYTTTQTPTISDATAGALIYYTTNGTTPTAASNLYSGPITVSASETIQAIALSAGNSPSAIGKAAYSISLAFTGPIVAQQCNNMVQYGKKVACVLTGIGAGHTLVIGIGGLSPTNPGTITASSGTPVQAITDGNTLSGWILPNTNAGSNQIILSANSDARLWLSVVEYENTAVSPLDGAAGANLSASWQSNGLLNTPNFTTSSPSDALWTFCSGVSGAPNVGVSPIVFTGLPTPTGGNLLVETGNTGAPGAYHGQCSSNEGEIIALALEPGTALAQAATPAFSLASGNYTSAQSVSITDSTPGATIYFTINGAPPTSASSVFSGPITVAASETLEAIAVSGSTTQSAVTSAAYTINTSETTPVITWATPAAITYGTALSATQLDATTKVAGTFSYSPASGILTAGNHTLTTTFNPTDTTDYSTATASVTLAVVSSGAAPAFVQQCNQYVQYGSSASCTLTGVGAGHTLVIGIAGAGTQSGSVITSAGTPVPVIQDGSILSAYLLANTSAGTITITFSFNGATKIHMSVAEYGNTSSAPLDGAASFVNPGNGNTISTPNITTTASSDLLWSYCAAPGGTTLTPGTAPILWTQRVSPNGTGAAVLVEDGVTTNSGSYYGQCTGPDAALEIVTLALKP
jgi:hypothetical protein